MKAITDLDKSLDEFIELMEKKDKQEIPSKQQEALGFVSIIEEAMVKGFPYEVPKQYANLPQLKVWTLSAESLLLFTHVIRETTCSIHVSHEAGTRR